MRPIYEHKRVAKSLKAAPIDALKQFEKWKNIVALSEPQGLKKIIGLRDESLAGEWKGCRSLRLNLQYRVIYKIDGDKIPVRVENVTPRDYRRK